MDENTVQVLACTSLFFIKETCFWRVLICECVYYLNHQESAGQSCEVCDPGPSVCANVSVCDRSVLLSMWQATVSGSENPQANAWAMHSQNLHKARKEKKHELQLNKTAELLDDCHLFMAFVASNPWRLMSFCHISKGLQALTPMKRWVTC